MRLANVTDSGYDDLYGTTSGGGDYHACGTGRGTVFNPYWVYDFTFDVKS